MPPPDPRTDAELIAAAAGGDVAAMEVLYYRYRDWIVRVAWRFTGHEADALDVLQDTFAFLLRRLPRLTLTCRLGTFLYPTIKHLALERRRRRALTMTEAAESAAPAAHPSELDAVVSALPTEQREVVLLRFVDDLALSEIAAALNVPAGTVKSRLHRALAALRADPRTREYFEER